MVRVSADAGIMREEGEGIPRMYEELEESFLKQPEFHVEQTLFSVTLRNQPIFEGPSPEWKGIVEKLVLTSTQKRVLLGHPDGFSNEDYRKLANLDRDHAYREIQELITMGVMVSSGAAGRGAVYYPSPTLLETRAWLEGRVAKLQVYLKAHERISNTAYRQLFSITRHAAKRELKRLTDEGFLALIGEKRGAHYISGPALVKGPKK